MRFQSLLELLGDDYLCETGGPLETVPSLDRRDTGNDGDGDSSGSHRVDPVDEDLDIVEHLGEDEVHARVDLVLEELHLPVAFVFGQELMLREPRDGDVKVISVFTTNVSNKIDTVDETAFDCLPLIFARGWVASKGKDVPTPGDLGFLD